MLICKSISLMRYSLYIIIIILFASCARRSSPSGGEQDSIPPVLVSSNPKINAVNFNKDEISREALVQKMIELHESGKIKVEA